MKIFEKIDLIIKKLKRFERKILKEKILFLIFEKKVTNIEKKSKKITN